MYYAIATIPNIINQPIEKESDLIKNILLYDIIKQLFGPIN